MRGYVIEMPQRHAKAANSYSSGREQRAISSLEFSEISSESAGSPQSTE